MSSCPIYVWSPLSSLCSVDSLTIHGLGTAIHRAINVALQLQETSTHPVVLATTTSTMQLVDDMEPVDDVSYLAPRPFSLLTYSGTSSTGRL